MWPASTEQQEYTLVTGTCTGASVCSNFIWYICMFVPLLFIRTLDNSAELQLQMRYAEYRVVQNCHFSESSLATCAPWPWLHAVLSCRLVGLLFIDCKQLHVTASIPAAMVGGLVLDSCCLMWNTDPHRRYCIRYDNYKLSWVLAGIGRPVLHVLHTRV
jgi:hypothetical protein